MSTYYVMLLFFLLLLFVTYPLISCLFAFSDDMISNRHSHPCNHHQSSRHNTHITYYLTGTGTIEEKIIQRQISKEGLSRVIANEDQHVEIASGDLKALFVLSENTYSDTHDTVCSRGCSAAISGHEPKNANSASSKSNGVSAAALVKAKRSLWPRQRELCVKFCEDLSNDLAAMSASYCGVGAGGDGSSFYHKEDIAQLITDLRKDVHFDTLPAFSKQLQRTCLDIQRTYCVLCSSLFLLFC